MAEYPSKSWSSCWLSSNNSVISSPTKLSTFEHTKSNTLQGALRQAYNILSPTERANIEGYKTTCDINFTSFDYEAIKLFRRVAFN